MKALKDKVYLRGNPPYALMVKNQPWEINSFRPNILNYLKPGKDYFAKIIYKVENLASGKEVYIPRKIQISVSNNLVIFVNMR